MSDTRQMNLRMGFGWAECLVVVGCSSHEVGFKFFEQTLPLLQQAFDVTEAVNPGLKKVLKQYVGHLPFLYNLVTIEGRIEPVN
eukprot:5381703-Ditylum_brightwellii.AAC.1